MRKEWEFKAKGHSVKVINGWFFGLKLYVDDECRDTDNSLTANGKIVLLSANLGESGILEITPKSGVFSIEMDAYLLKDEDKQHVYSSHKRLSLSEQRLAK
jgi:hypothetical protein